MPKSLRHITLVFLVGVVSGASALAAELRPIVLHEQYDHDRFQTRVTGWAGEANHERRFRAFVSVFDGADDDDGDGVADALGVPHFVAYELKRYEGTLPLGPQRPGTWITDRGLRQLGLAPRDSSYRYSHAFRRSNPNWYIRGHLCMKQHAWRLGANADWNTHTVLNAVPQRQDFNAGIWLDLEDHTASWADSYGSVWIVAGPVFEPQPNSPNAWLGEPEKGEMPVAIPDALFKIVVRASGDRERPEVLAFIFPQDAPGRSPYEYSNYLTSVDLIEQKTGLDLLSALPDEIEATIESRTADVIWPVPTTR